MTARARKPVAGGLMDVVVLALLCGTIVALVLMLTQHAWGYYTTPIAQRGYQASHHFLRPSGTGGHLLGIVGTLFLFLTLPYLARKRMRLLARAGTVPHWLEAHIFCGVFGPILVTLHTSFKFNGLVSVAFWSMALVVLSGFMGRHLYAGIPRTIRGEELSRSELEGRAAELKTEISETTLPIPLLAKLEEEERLLLSNASMRRSVTARLRESLAARRRAALLRREFRQSGLNRHLLHDALALAHERAVLLRKIARLERTRRLFQVWHVFHRPLVWVMFLVFFVHLGVAIYFGYTPLGG